MPSPRHIVHEFCGSTDFAAYEDVTLRVTGTFNPALPGQYYGEMSMIDPPEPASFDIAKLEIMGSDKEWHEMPDWLLTKEQLDEIEEEAIRSLPEDDGPDPDDAREDRRERDAEYLRHVVED